MANITFAEGSGLQDSIYGKSQAPIRMFIEKRGEAFEQASIAKEIFLMEKSKNWAERTTSMTTMEGFQPVGENGAYPVDGMREGYDKLFEHEVWKNSFSISREMVDDAKLMDLKKQPTAFVTAYYRTREMFAAAMLGEAIKGNSSFNFRGKTFSTLGADGSALFVKTHANKEDGAQQSNLFADAFSNDALMAAEEHMQNTTDDSGNILDVAPNTILIPNQYALKKAVFAAIGADKDPATANNGFNYNFGRWNVIVWPYLNQFITSGTSPWVLLDTEYNKTYQGAVWYDRTGLEVKSLIDDGNDANVWHGYARWSAGFNDWRFASVGGVTGGTTLVS